MSKTAPVAAVSAAIRRDGRFLLVLRAHAPARGLYAFPGGRIEPGESAEAAVRREVIEETGVRVEEVRHYRDIELGSAATRLYRLSVFVCAYGGGEAVAGDDAEEAGWYTTREMESLPMTGSTYDIALEIERAETAAA